MEAFSLLKYWRGGGLGGAGAGDNGANLRTKNETTTTIVTAIANHAVDTDDDEGDGDDDDDGPFFDLEFTVPDDDDAEDNKNNNEENSSEEDEENDDVVSDDDDVGTDGDEREFKFTLSSNSSNDRTDPNLTLSPSDDLFFKGRLVPIEPSLNGSEPNSKPQFPVSLLKSATKFRVFMLGFKKSKPNANEKTETNGSAAAPKQQQQQQQKPEDTQQEEDNNSNNKKESNNKFFTVKFKVEEVPIMSLFTRDNSSRNSSTNNKSQKQNSTSSDDSASDEKKFSKDVMQKYLKKVKPLYIRVSKRYGEKLRFSGQLSLGSGPKPSLPPPPPPPQSTVAQKTVKSTAEKSQSEAESAEAPVMSNVKSLKQANIPAGLRVVCKHLGKSRSASSAVAAAPPGSVPSRRDDSLLEQQDGIQSAILHCKRSFNASRDCESTLLSRSVSDPSREKSIDLSRKKSSDKGKINIFDAEGIL